MIKYFVPIFILIIGLSGIVAQLILLRELLIVFAGNELTVGIILANWLVLEAFGCFFLGKQVEKIKNKIEVFVGIIILFSLSLLVTIYLTRILKNILGVSIGEELGFLPILYSSFILLLPTSVSHGVLFTFSCKVYSNFSANATTSVGKVYVYETIGTIIGGIAWTYLLIPYFNTFYMAVGLATLNLFASFILLIFSKNKNSFKNSLVAICGILLIFSTYLLFNGRIIDKLHYKSIKDQWSPQNIVHYQNSVYGNICVVENEGQYLFFLDGILHITTPIADIFSVEEFVHIPLLSHPSPKKILILGGGAGGVINQVLKHPSVEIIDYAELDPLVIELVRKFPTPMTEYELNNPKVKLKHIDGRLFLKITQDKYDVIFVGFSKASDIQVNRFFTKEFFQLAKKKMYKDGILVIALDGSLTYISDELRNLNACIFNTLKSVFAYVRAIPGEGRILFISSRNKEISLINKTTLVNRLKERDLQTHLVIPWYIEYKLHPKWTDWFSEFFEGTTQRINEDFKCVGVFYNLAYWNTRLSPYLCPPFRWLEKINIQVFFILFIIFVLPLVFFRRKNKKFLPPSIPLCIFTTGFAGMIFELALIYAFQAIYGYVFSWIGLLVTSFMTGTAVGATAMTSALRRIKNDLKFFIVIELAIICFSLGLPFVFLILHPYLDSPEKFLFLKILFLILSFISGLLIGAQFPLANKIYLKGGLNLSKTAAVLYSLDLLGGWLGGVVGGVILLPLLGLLETCIITTLIKLVSFVIIKTGKVQNVS